MDASSIQGRLNARSGPLLPQHAALLKASAISDEVAAERGYRSVTVKAELTRLGFSERAARVPALLLPVHGVTGEIVLFQIRADAPRIESGKPIKYETPHGSRMALDVPPSALPGLADPAVPLFVTEGIRKADAAASLGLCCIAVIGVWNWRGTNEFGGKTALADWESIALNERIVYIVFDSDVMTKISVHQALARLKAFLESRHADAQLIYLPSGPGGAKVGLDDFLAAEHGVDDLLALATTELRAAPAGNGPAGSPYGADPIGGKEPAPFPPPAEPMRVANQLVAERYGGAAGGLILRHWRGEFWHWQASHWLEVADPTLRAECYLYTEHAVFVKMKNEVPMLEPWAPNRYRVADLLDALRAVTHLSETVDMPVWLDGRDHLPATELVACANGLLHVPTRTLLPHDNAYFNRVAVPFDYQADPPRPTGWLAFLDELWHDDPDAIAALAEFMGYVISGRRDLHKILLLIGPTRAGKGVIARVLKPLVGRGNYAGPTLASLGTNFGLSPLIGKPLAIISDARLGGANVHQVVERLLSVSGEDALTVDIKYKEPWTGTLPTRFLVISNELPRFGDASGAIANRFVVLTLRESWLGRENPALTDELLSELPGILGWVLDGLDRLNARGRFTEPPSSTDAIVALADLVSPTSAFVRDQCEVGPASEVPCDELYAAWRTWAVDNGHRVSSSSSFGRDLRAVLPGLRTVRPRDDDRQRLYRGLRLATDRSGSVRGPSWTRPASGPAVQDGPGGQPLWADWWAR
jgi:putative DNA primase/helicase